jgi:quercetin dioxygenase-like cupin family protein
VSGYTILDLGELEAFPYHQRGGQKMLPIERTLDYRAAGINGWTGDPGEPLVPEHTEDSGEEELYVVVRGRASFTVDGTHIDAPAGTLIHVLSGETRAAVSEEAGTIIVVIGGTIGEARKPSGWTSFVIADALRREGRIDEARVAISDPIEMFPDAWEAPYNAACFEALAGDADAAFAYLQQALRLDTQAVRGYAPNDSDLDSLHDDPRWKKVAG